MTAEPRSPFLRTAGHLIDEIKAKGEAAFNGCYLKVER